MIHEVHGAETAATSAATTATDVDDAVGAMPSIAERIGPYTLISEIGHGGMGRVFLAEDAKLDRKVAIKFIALRGTTAQLRFLDEARLTARCRHRNIVVIHDIAEHEGVPYLVLEHVDGPTLAALLAGEPLPVTRAVAIATQVARALAHAHAHGIVHRDLKPANILLDADGTAKVVDFGIACHRDDASAGGGATGTLAYMAPEQLRGEAIDARADLFALGVTMYQMLCGHLPFAGLSDAELRARVSDLDRPMPSLAAERADLPAALTALVDRCLEKRVERRITSANDVLAALAPMAVATAPSRRGWPAIAIAASFVALGVAAVLLIQRDRASMPALTDRVSFGRRAVAVLGFENLSGSPDSAWLSGAMSELLNADLAVGNALRPISAENVERARRDLGLRDVETLAADTLDKVRRSLGSDYVVVGSYLASARTLRVDLRLQHARTGETVAVLSETRAPHELSQLSSALAASVRARLGAGLPVPPVASSTVLPADAADARAYIEGLSLLRLGEHQDARDRFERVIAGDPDFAPAHRALAESLYALGYDGAATGEARRAVDLGKALPPSERWKLQELLYRVKGQSDQVAALQRQRFAAHPDDLDAGVGLLETLVVKLAHDDDEVDALIATLRAASRHTDIRVERLDVARDLTALETAIAEARRIGWVEYELEGRLAAAELDPRRAPALIRDATKHGFRNIARRARELRGAR